jgi:hypothetical protein
MNIKRIALFALAFVIALSGVAVADLMPRRADPTRRKGGESFPPLPLPATPLRRTEKKRPPSPPVLFTRLQYGSGRIVENEGEKVTFFDWNTDPDCLNALCKKCRAVLGVKYKDVSCPLARLDGDPAQIPIVFLTGHKNFTFTPEEKTKLRDYIRQGGFLWAEACCGEKEFFTCAAALAKELFPGGEVKRLPMDHPIFHSTYDLAKVAYSPAAAKDESEGLPCLYGLDLGCRTAFIFSPYDLSCGWEGHQHDGKLSVAVSDAQKLGVNMVAYCLAYHALGMFLAKDKVYYEESEGGRTDFVFAQLKHGGQWDTNPSAAANLLKALKASGGTNVKFKRVDVDLSTTDLFSYPFLYMTGHDDFKWSDDEVKKLKAFVENGGFLFADACCGREAFIAAFRREIARVFPDNKLERLALDHPVYGSRFKIGEVAYTSYLQKLKPDLKAPALEGVTFEGATRVIFSEYGIGNGWECVEHSFTKGYSSEDALRLGVNVIVYSLTH